MIEVIVNFHNLQLKCLVFNYKYMKVLLEWYWYEKLSIKDFFKEYWIIKTFKLFFKKELIVWYYSMCGYSKPDPIYAKLIK